MENEMSFLTPFKFDKTSLSPSLLMERFGLVLKKSFMVRWVMKNLQRQPTKLELIVV